MYEINGLYPVVVDGINTFLDANPSAGRANGTQITDAWLNDVQGELLNILSAAGIAPAASTPTQVLTALQQLFGAPAFTSNLSANGWKKYPDNNSPTGFFIEQWGTSQNFGSGERTATIIMPLTFPNVCRSCNGNDVGGACYAYGLDVASNSSLTWNIPAASLGTSTTPVASTNATIRWQAKGY
jgi:hypothetical protein